jgi:hypothetical protein
MSIEAMKLALEALETNYALINGTERFLGLDQIKDTYYAGCFDVDGINKQTNDSITALRTAIEQAEKHDPTGKNYLPVEPVGWMHNQIEGVVITHRPADVDRHPERWERIYKECKA